LCAAGAALVQEAADGRFILGLGVSHRYTLGNLGIEMGNARERLRSYTATLRKMFAGEPVSAEFPLRLRVIPKPIPIYYGALTIETARLGGELADGLLLYLCSPKRMRDAIAAASQRASSNGRKPDEIAVTVGLPAFVDEDRGRALQAARMGLAFYASLPFFNRILSRNGFEAEAKAVAEAAAKRDFAAMGSALSERLLDSLALVGPPAKCIDRLAEYREMGGKFPIIVPNVVNETYVSCVRKNLNVFGRAVRA